MLRLARIIDGELDTGRLIVLIRSDTLNQRILPRSQTRNDMRLISRHPRIDEIVLRIANLKARPRQLTVTGNVLLREAHLRHLIHARVASETVPADFTGRSINCEVVDIGADEIRVILRTHVRPGSRVLVLLIDRILSGKRDIRLTETV